MCSKVIYTFSFGDPPVGYCVSVTSTGVFSRPSLVYLKWGGSGSENIKVFYFVFDKLVLQ